MLGAGRSSRQLIAQLRRMAVHDVDAADVPTLVDVR